MHLGHLTILIAFTVMNVTSDECSYQEIVRVVKRHLIKNYAYENIDGAYSDLWVDKGLFPVQKCGYSSYIKTGEGSVKVKRIKTIRDDGLIYPHTLLQEEYCFKTSVPGEFDMWGDAPWAKDKLFHGKGYFFYADINVKASYACIKDGPIGSFSIWVRNSKKHMLLSKGDNDMKKSLSQAEAAMDVIFKELGYDRSIMALYDVKDLCP